MTFERAFDITCGGKTPSAIEGGLSDRKADRGGHTYRGFTQRQFTLWLEDKKQPDRDVITITDDERYTIAHDWYWLRAHCNVLNERCGCLHFDAAFNSGPANAIRILQAACGAEVDGSWGPETEQKSRPDCFDAYFVSRKAFYQHIIDADQTGEQMLNWNGWMNRLTRLREILA